MAALEAARPARRERMSSEEKTWWAVALFMTVILSWGLLAVCLSAAEETPGAIGVLFPSIMVVSFFEEAAAEHPDAVLFAVSVQNAMYLLIVLAMRLRKLAWWGVGAVVLVHLAMVGMFFWGS